MDTAEPPDAAIEPVCPMVPGTSYLITQFGIAPYESGVDLDGDGEIDNQLGNIPESVREAVGEGFDRAIASGDYLIGMHLEGLSDPPTENVSDVTFYGFTLLDADVPADASNNLTGGEFWAREEFLNLNCQPNSPIPGEINDRVFRGAAPRLTFPLTTGTGTLEMINLSYESTFEPDFATGSGFASAYITLCSFSGVPLPLSDEVSGSALDFLINDPATAAAVKIDVDIDGDGLEQVIGDGVGVLHCIDGDGTVIEGRDCPCHPAIADAYSGTLELGLLEVPIIGVR